MLRRKPMKENAQKNIGRIPWNRGLTKDKDERVSRQYKAPRIIVKCTYCGTDIEIRTTEFVEGNSYFCKGNRWACFHAYHRGENHHKKDYRKGRISWCKGLTKETDERLARAIVKQSESLKLQYLNGTKTPKCGRTRYYEYTSPIVGKITCQGTYEYEFAKVLDMVGEKWEKSKERFKYFTDDEWHVYIPDFTIEENGNRIFLDTKSDYRINLVETKNKITAVRLQNKESEFLIITIRMINQVRDTKNLDLEMIRSNQPY